MAKLLTGTRIYGTGTVDTQLFVSGSANASSTLTGALQIVGGVGIGGNLYVGGTINASVTGIVSTATSIALGTAGQVPYQTGPGVTSFFGPGTAGNVLVSNGTTAPTYNNTLTLAGTTAASSTNTGALQVRGGVGVGGNLYVGGNETITGDLEIQGGDLTTNQSTFNLLNATAATVNFASAGTAISIGASTGNTTVKNNLVVVGNITVQGTTTIVDSTVTNISDPIITLGGNANNAAPTVDDNKDRGVAFKWYDGGVAKVGFFGFQDSTKFFTFYNSATIANEIVTPAGGSTKSALDAYLAGGSAQSIVYQSAPNVTAFLAASTSGYVLQTNSTGSAPTWVAPGGLTAGIATQVNTALQTANASYYPTFVDANNASATGEALYTTGSFVINPSTGNVGIGTASPGYKLDANLGIVNNNSNYGYNIFADATSSVGYAGYNLQLNNSTANATGYIRLARTASTAYLGMELASQSRDGIRFLTSATTPAEVMRLDSTGNVGIGVTPSAWTGGDKALQMGSTAAYFTDGASVHVSNNFYQSAASTFDYLTTAAATDYYQYAGTHVWRNAVSGTAGNAITFTQAMTLDASGNLGIGTFTTSIAKKLTVVGEGNFTDASNNTRLYMGFGTIPATGGTGAYVYNNDNSPLVFGTSNTERVRIDSSGNVILGYNTTATQYVYRSFATGHAVANRGAIVSFGMTDGGGLAGMSVYNTTATNTSFNAQYVSFTTHEGGVSTGERMRITSKGGISFGATGTAVGTAGQVLQSNADAAPTWVAPSGLTAGAAAQVNTIRQTASASYYPTFVDSNNASATAESFYTTSSFVINPGTGAAAFSANTASYTLSLTNTAVGADKLLLNLTGAVNSFSIYENAQAAYLNSYAGMSLRVNQLGGSAGLINLSGGNVYVASSLGVGTNTPGAKLEVLSGTEAAGGLQVSLTGEAYGPNTTSSRSTIYDVAGTIVRVTASTNSTATAALINFNAYNATGGATGVFAGAVSGSTGNGPAHYVIGRRTAAQTWAETFRITQNGGVSFGTAGTAVGTSGQVLQSNGDAAPTWVAPSGLTVSTANNAVNIRTIAQTASASYFPTFVDTNNAANAYELLYTTSSFVINPQSGNVGIGTTPSAKLHVLGQESRFGGVASAFVSFYDNSGRFGYIQANGGTDLRIAAEGASTPMTFLVNTSERVRINTTGNVLIGTQIDSGYKLEVNGSFAAVTKSFVINHPTKPGMKLRYGSLEGPENGIYVRGKLTGSNKIELPEYWTKLVDPDSITVSLTPIGKHQDLYVADISNNVVTVGNGNILSKAINCFYVVYGERVDVDKLIVEI